MEKKIRVIVDMEKLETESFIYEGINLKQGQIIEVENSPYNSNMYQLSVPRSFGRTIQLPKDWFTEIKVATSSDVERLKNLDFYSQTVNIYLKIEYALSNKIAVERLTSQSIQPHLKSLSQSSGSDFLISYNHLKLNRDLLERLVDTLTTRVVKNDLDYLLLEAYWEHLLEKNELADLDPIEEYMFTTATSVVEKHIDDFKHIETVREEITKGRFVTRTVSENPLD